MEGVPGADFFEERILVDEPAELRELPLDAQLQVIENYVNRVNEGGAA